MNTKSSLRGAAAAVSGGRHVRLGRNGQDAAVVWIGETRGGVDDATSRGGQVGVGAATSRGGNVGGGHVGGVGEVGAATSRGGHVNVGGVVGAVVVCDGCGSGASSEVGARLGAQLVLAAIARRMGADALPLDADSAASLDAASFDGGTRALDGGTRAPLDGGSRALDSASRSLLDGGTRDGGTRAPLDGGSCVPLDAAFWDLVRADVVRALDAIVCSMVDARAPSVPAWVAREQIVHDHFLFTTIAAVMIDDVIAVWAIGDGAYAIDGRVRELGPFENNQPPYLGYDLLANIVRRPDSRQLEKPGPVPGFLEVTRGSSVIVATDGVAEIGLDHFAGVDRFVAHPDALRRHLALLARTDERIDWDARRVVRTPALLQDDGAVAMLVRDIRQGGVS
jgi:hypothetical protein